MGTEIEKKWLIDSASNIPREKISKSLNITQGYLVNKKALSVRIRSSNNDYFLTVKGDSKDNGLSRREFETKIPNWLFSSLKIFVSGRFLEKTRHIVVEDNFEFEVDVFAGGLNGIVLAELELSSTDEQHPVPTWLGKEVTGVPEYLNANLIKRLNDEI